VEEGIWRAGLVKLYLLSIRLPSKYLVQSVKTRSGDKRAQEVRVWEGEKLHLASRLETLRRSAYSMATRVFAYVEELGVWVAVSDEAREEAEKISAYVKEEMTKLGLAQYTDKYVARVVTVYLEPEEAERVLNAAIKRLSADTAELQKKIEDAKKEQNRKALLRLEREKTYKEALLQSFKNYLARTAVTAEKESEGKDSIREEVGAIVSRRVSDRVRTLIEDSWSFFERGVGELEEGLGEGDVLKVRDAVEKLWNAVVSAANALVLSRTGIVPASHWERRRLLDKIEEGEPEVERLGLGDRYGARERYLQEMTFHDGIIDRELLEREVEKVKRFIEDVQRLLGSAPER